LNCGLKPLQPVTFHESSRFPQGFRCASRNCGLKPVDKDLALFVSDREAAAAAVFTRNQFPGAPVVLGRETVCFVRSS
jgi:glutamate N-acetyltransferase/amino-acid N-acetyltransferase